ncbi:MBL fold metallo-hydrolase [Microbacterium sp. gxy059]|uniref:MBL fold metallo-hydrolase n=1 Tax=Microbacterium sp. gxy059 TaxID=2957199 RepID=UPI003D96F2B5
MRVTKHEHALLSVRQGGETLVIDPGGFAPSLGDLGDVTAVVVTHEHPDHADPRHLTELAERFPDARMLTTTATAEAAPVPMTVVAPGDEVSAGVFRLRFFGGAHSEIHSSIPIIDNLGVLVNDALYYPGDSYALPGDAEVALLAAPIGAPWLKIGEAMDFVLAARPRRAFGTHDATLSEIGLRMHRERLAWATEEHGGTFHPLDAGESIEVTA